MTLLSQILLEASQETSQLHELARRFVSRILIPRTLTRSLLQKYVRKAIQNKSWYSLPQPRRALLYVASRTISKVKSPTLRKLLEEIILEIELATTKAQALYYGLILLIKQAPQVIGNLLSRVKQLLNKILFLGINYLNNPPIYRIYG